MSLALIKRRSLITSLGALGFLAVPVFRETLAEAQTAPLRLIVFYFPGGTGTQENFTFGKMASPLAAHSSDILLFDGVSDPLPGVGGGHSAHQTMLTGNGGGNIGDVAGPAFLPPDLISVDQIIAQAIGSQTRFASLQFGVNTDQPPMGDDLPDRGRCVYANGAAVPPVNDPQTMFTRLFSGAVAPTGAPPTAPTTPANVAQLQALATQQKSMLDTLKAQVTSLQAIVGSAEKQRLDEHLGSLRELEKGIMSPSSAGGGGQAGGTVPVPGVSCGAPMLGSAADDPSVGVAMNELLYQAVNCDLTRVATQQWYNDNQQVVFTWTGVDRGQHMLQHAGGPDFDKVQTWLLSQAAATVKRLKDTPEGGGSMLDNTLMLVMSDMGEGSLHSCAFIPALIAGKAGGAVRTGRTYSAGGSARNNLLLSVARTMGVTLAYIGDPQYTSPFDLS